MSAESILMLLALAGSPRAPDDVLQDEEARD